MTADVVIVGGGPVGCWTALEIKKRNPALHVQVYERYEEYQRDHMLSIRSSSLTRHGKRAGDALEATLYKQIADAHSSAAAPADLAELPAVTHIRTLDFERILKDQCAQRGVNFTYERIESPEDAMARHPECRLFVAADGARSAMRTALLGDDGVARKDILYSVDVKYTAQGQARYLRKPTYNTMDMLVVETVGRAQDGQSDVALRFLVDKQTYDSIPEATFKAPLSSKTVGPFEKQIDKFQKLRAIDAGEIKIPGSERITKISLSQYASKKFAVTVGDETRRAGWFFVGDAAMGLPFYRSINSGLAQGARLGAIIAGADRSPTFKAGLYNASRPLKLADEFGRVALKTAGLNAYRHGVRPALRGLKIVGLGIVIVPVIAVVGLYMLINPRARLM